jgi:hypothetical protein
MKIKEGMEITNEKRVNEVPDDIPIIWVNVIEPYA